MHDDVRYGRNVMYNVRITCILSNTRYVTLIMLRLFRFCVIDKFCWQLAGYKYMHFISSMHQMPIPIPIQPSNTKKIATTSFVCNQCKHTLKHTHTHIQKDSVYRLQFDFKTGQSFRVNLRS